MWRRNIPHDRRCQPQPLLYWGPSKGQGLRSLSRTQLQFNLCPLAINSCMSKFGIHHFNIFQHGSTMSNDNLWLTCSTQGSYQPSIPLQPALDGPWASLGAEPCQANVFFSTPSWCSCRVDHSMLTNCWWVTQFRAIFWATIATQLWWWVIFSANQFGVVWLKHWYHIGIKSAHTFRRRPTSQRMRQNGTSYQQKNQGSVFMYV